MLAYSILFFFILRLLTDFVEAVYTFGLLGVNLPVEMALIFLWFSPLLLLPFKRSFSMKTLIVLGEIVILLGAIDPMLDTRLRLFVSGAGNAVFMVFIPALLVYLHDHGKRDETARLTGGLVLAILMSIVLRAWVSGINPSGSSFGQLLGLVLAGAGGIWLVRHLTKSSEPQEAADKQVHPVQASFWRLTGLSIGLVACILMVFFAIQSPHVMARWADLDALMVVVVSVLALVMASGAWMFMTRRKAGFPRWVVLIWNSLFTLAVAAALLPQQVRFPDSPSGYPLFPSSPSSLAGYTVYAVILLSPVLLVDFWLYADQIVAGRPTLRRLGGSFGLVALFLLLMVIFQIATTVYDYLPVIGPLLRDRYWLVFTLLALAVSLPVLLLPEDMKRAVPAIPSNLSNLAAILGTAAIAGVMSVTGNPGVPAELPDRVRVVTYNIQQAYSDDGQRSLVALVDLMHQLKPDIIGLQETDSLRIAGGNSDLVRYLCDHLSYYCYSGPGVVPGTFGVALLSRFPIENARHFYMYSEGEQTASILADIAIGETTYTVLVTHLGNHGPIVQQEAVLEALAGQENILAMGDFNFRPETDQYALTVQTLDDSWLLLDSEPSGDFDPTRRIDYVFLSPGMTVVDAQFLTGPESDHPGYMIEIQR